MKAILLSCCALALTVFAKDDLRDTRSLEKCENYEQRRDCCQQGECCDCLSACNAPAAFRLCPVSNVNFFADASFTYWFAGEEGLRIATSGIVSGTTVFLSTDTRTFNQSFDYHPGFKVGIGLIGDNQWEARAEYTWFRGAEISHSPSLSTSVMSPAGAVAAPGTPTWITDSWFMQGTPAQALPAGDIKTKWRLAVDMIDLTVGRPFYQASCLVISPFTGLRAAFIRQFMRVQITESPTIYPGTQTPQPIASRNDTHSWGVGPILGADGRYLLPMGFRFEGNGAASLLYTSYTKLRHSEDVVSTAFTPGPYISKIYNYNCLRPILQLGLGFGWASYLDCQRYHIDLSADYDFQFFWGQNMLRKAIDDPLLGTAHAALDLFLHGLTIKGRFDF
jgi:hypothetical protein